MEAHQKDFENIFVRIEGQMTKGMTENDVETFRTLLGICLKNLQK